MVTTYSTIQQLKDQNIFKRLLEKGLISLSFESYFQIYEYYLAQRKIEPKKLQAICNTSEKFNVSERSIYTIVKRMNS